MFRSICSGSRARSKSSLGSIFPLNSSRKNSACTGIPTKISVYTKRSKENRVHAEVEHSIYRTGREKKITDEIFALAHSSTRLEREYVQQAGHTGGWHEQPAGPKLEWSRGVM